MKNKTVIILLSVLAVALYTVAVINFCMGNVLGGIGDRQRLLSPISIF